MVVAFSPGGFAMVRRLLAFVCASVMFATLVQAEADSGHPLDGLSWRNIGPANMSGRVADVEGVPGDPRTVYVGSASGGIWKSTDGGVTFAPIFDDQPVASIGDLALAPSNPSVIYVGTGEENVRNSVSFGNGVYRSTDAGETFTHIGLEDTQTISHIVVDPRDENRAFVAAIGPIFGPRDARGVFRTTDGGGSWRKVLYLDEDHGAADLDIDPTNPNILFATLWKFRRQPWTFVSGSEEGGVWRSRDGGDTWKKLENGLPKLMGRVAVKIAPSDPNVVYVIAESNDGILFRSDDRGESFRKVSDDVRLVSRGFYYTDLRVDPNNANVVYAIASRLFRSVDGGKTFERIARPVHIDFHSLWVDPEDSDRIWVGEDGGVATTVDGGGSWHVPRTLPLGQYYQVFVGHEESFYTVGGGLQDNGTWFGPSRTREPAGITVHDFRMMSFGDAYFTLQHPEKPYLYLSESQGGNILRTDVRTRQQQVVSPQPARNDGGPVSGLEYRFNWNAPIVASPYDSETVYFCGNVVFKSRDFGSSWETISPDLTTDDAEKQGTAGGPVWPENTTAEYHTTIISFAVSPVEQGVLWVGTDDGNLQLSRDEGGTWSKLTVPGVPAFSPVSHVEASTVDAGQAYVAFDRHMFDDLAPHIYRTDDYGATWRRIVDGLPEQGWVWVVREDPVNPDLLYAGTEVGLWASWDRGDHWRKLHLENLPTVSIHDIVFHGGENDIILGTHGRAIWILDDATPIQRFRDTEDKTAHLFPVQPAISFPMRFTRYGLGDDVWKAPNPPYGALISYFLAPGPEDEDGPAESSTDDETTDEDGSGGDDSAEEAEQETVELAIVDASGTVIRELDDLPSDPGVHRVAWDLRRDPPTPRNADPDEAAEFFGPSGGPTVVPGRYTARLTARGETHETAIEVRIDPQLDADAEDLETQASAAGKLASLVESSNLALRALDRVREQLDSRRDVHRRMREDDLEDDDDPVVEAMKGLEESLDAEFEVWERDDGKPFWSQGPKLGGRLGRFYREIDGAFARPSGAQIDFLRQLTTETEAALDRLETFLTETLPDANRTLAEHGIPEIAVPESP